jgi:hypothetical protein
MKFPRTRESGERLALPFKERRSTFRHSQINTWRIPKTRISVYSRLLQIAMAELPSRVLRTPEGRNGEGIFHDEAEIQKRIISYRLSRYLQPNQIIESHPGLGLGSRIYREASPTSIHGTINATIPVSPSKQIILVDIDPFGSPWSTLNRHAGLVQTAQVVQITSGEIYAVVRNWKRAQRIPTMNFGKLAPKWVEEEYIPNLERFLGKKCRYFYAFPTSVRVVLSNSRLPSCIWAGCLRWLSWFGNTHV